MDESIFNCRKETSDLPSILRRKVSIYISYVLIKLGFKAEHVCIGWGLIHVANSYLLYKSITGLYYLIPVYIFIQIFADILDVVDGEIARYRNSINPITGKLLDGIGHRMTEYSILIAFSYGILERTGLSYSLLIGFVAVFGEAMFTYCTERKVIVIRLYAEDEVHKKITAETKRYPVNMKFSQFTWEQRFEAVKGLFIYRSVYLIILLAYLHNSILILGFTLLAIYKNYCWIKLMRSLIYNPPKLKEDAIEKAAYWKNENKKDT